jgi:HYR domain
VPSNITTEATSSTGAVVTYTATAKDPVYGSITPTCVPASGATFPIGTTSVTCTATDAVHNTGSATFTVTVTPLLLSSPNSISANFNGTPIASGDYIWFSNVLKASGIPAAGANIYLTSSTITFTANGVTSHLAVPNAIVTFSPQATTASTTFANGVWHTTVPVSGISWNIFISGLPYHLSTSLPGAIKNVTWTGTFGTDTKGVSLQWQWAAAVYDQFSTNESSLGVKPVDDSHADPTYPNSDRPGTPEVFKSYVIGGATGGGGSNYTGGYSGTNQVTP